MSSPEPRGGAEARVGAVFSALADPTRRHLLRSLAERPDTATALSATLPISRQAVAKHLELLDRVGLVSRRRSGREAIFELRTPPLAEAAGWLEAVGAEWDGRLARLRRAIGQAEAAES